MNDKTHIHKRNREVNSLLDFNSEDIVYEDDIKEKNQDNRNNKTDEKSHDSHRYDDHNERNNEFSKKDRNHNDKKIRFNNPVNKLITEEICYDKNQAYKALVKQDGLYKMIKDLKDWSKNPKDKKRPFYIQNCLKDIVVAAALPSAIDDIRKDNKYELEKKDFDLLMDEIFTVVRNSEEDSRLQSRYGKDAIDAMREAYMSILYKFNKKKLKKLEQLDLSEDIAKKIVILTSGKNPNNSFYALLKFFYRNSKRIEMSEKLFIKIFKICYGKDNINTVIKCLMNEKVNPIQNNPFNTVQENSSESRMYVLLDKLMRDQLESMSKRDCKNTILAYIKERKIAKKRNDMVRRRFGDRRTIHPEDYPRLTEVLEKLEADDFSVIEYLR